MASFESIEAYFKLSEQERLARFLGADTAGLSNGKQYAIGRSHYVVLHEDGTVTAHGDNSFGQCGVDGWKNVIKVAAGDNHTVGLKRDGTVLAVGDNECGQCNVAGWPRLTDIFAERSITVGVFSVGDGTGSPRTLLVYASSAHTAPGARAITEQQKKPADEQKNPVPKPVKMTKWEAIEKINKYAEFYVKHALSRMGKSGMFYVHRLEMLDEDFLNELYRNLLKNYSVSEGYKPYMQPGKTE